MPMSRCPCSLLALVSFFELWYPNHWSYHGLSRRCPPYRSAPIPGWGSGHTRPALDVAIPNELACVKQGLQQLPLANSVRLPVSVCQLQYCAQIDCVLEQGITGLQLSPSTSLQPVAREARNRCRLLVVLGVSVGGRTSRVRAHMLQEWLLAWLDQGPPTLN